MWQLSRMAKKRIKTKRKLASIRLRQWREHRNKTQEQVADALGISVAHVSRIERGERQYTQEILEAAAEYLETDPEGIWSLWDKASVGQRHDIERLAEVVVTRDKKAG